MTTTTWRPRLERFGRRMAELAHVLLGPVEAAVRDELVAYLRPVPTSPDAPAQLLTVRTSPAPATPPEAPTPQPRPDVLPWPEYRPGHRRQVVGTTAARPPVTRPRRTPKGRKGGKKAAPANRVRALTRKLPRPAPVPAALKVIRCDDCGTPVVLVPDDDDPGVCTEVCPACPLPVELAGGPFACPVCGGEAALLPGEGDGSEHLFVCLDCPIDVSLAPDPDDDRYGY